MSSFDILALCDAAKAWLDKLQKEGNFVSNVKTVQDDVVVCKIHHSVHASSWETGAGGTGGVGYAEGVAVYFKGRAAQQKWQWRDCWYERSDKPWLAIHGIGAITVTVSGKATVAVELVNNHYRNRTVVFEF